MARQEITDKEIIESLLSIISEYQKDGISKDLLLDAQVVNGSGTICLTKLVTKGEVGIDTPFYNGSIKTMIIQEFIDRTETYAAEILYTEKGE